MFAGKALKKIVSGINSETITFVTHSLGAKVAVFALFNVDNDLLPTLSNSRINICLIAPAISAEVIFDNYYKRNSKVDFKSKDNYKISIVYNEQDFVLLKKDPIVGWFGPGPFEYGNTTLGCNYNNVAKALKTKFLLKLQNSPIELFNFAFVGKCHYVSCYCIDDSLEEVFRYLNQ